MFQTAYHPTILPFVFSLIFSVALAVYALRKEQTPIIKTFAWLMVALSVWTFCYGMELITISLEGKTFWDSVKYFGSTTGPTLWFVLALQLTRHEHWLTRPLKILLIVFCVSITAVVLTNQWHGWYWTEIWLEPGQPETMVNHGFFFWVYAIGPYLMILTSVALLFSYYRNSPPMYRRQAFLMALGGFLPLSLRMLEDIFGIDLFPLVDNIPLALLASSLFFAAAIFRFGALEMVHIAHDLVVQNISAGLIVIDNQEQVIDLNAAAQALINHPRDWAVGRKVSEIIPDAQVQSGATILFERGGDEVQAVVQRSVVQDHRGEPIGESLLLIEVQPSDEPARAVKPVTFTLRQEEVIALVATGMTNKEIATELTVSESTVKYHVGQLLEKLSLQTRYELRDYMRRRSGKPLNEDV
ncbi:MAG: histidine kinase N-terminal 7TM domain-containing protein [Chloroflexota bacterium]